MLPMIYSRRDRPRSRAPDALVESRLHRAVSVKFLSLSVVLSVPSGMARVFHTRVE